jgi:dTDP-4-dehydrorhamnose 3,5-epimerase
MKLTKTKIRGLHCVDYVMPKDARGEFLKIFSPEIFRGLFPAKKLEEVFVTRSARNVIRGMHFQSPPFEHDKLVSCIQGKILDVVFDMRKRSDTFGKFQAFRLNAKHPQGLLIPRGCAHGLLSLSDDTLVCYLTNRRHNRAKDSGIHWSSFGFRWPVKKPILSRRDEIAPLWNPHTSLF